MDFPELYILRHGETVWNAENRMQGGLNSPLTEKGRAQAARQGELLSGLDLDGFAALSSPQGRAFETAAIAVAPLIPLIRTDDRLREIGVGEWQGKVRDDLRVHVPVVDGPDGPLALYEHAPGGEGFAGLEQRCRAFLADLAGPVVIVTHGITSRMLRCLSLGLGRDALANMPGGQGNVFHLKDGAQTELV
ncbi:histidine phosphatase family protein [Yoonia sp. 2307UL14-13]|uniref:histidine phosphatase family protein n=1 Tax=Yoonia sp. 2307UL14-13 TaxID=3126506 RepID=UPI0030A2162E